MKFAFIDIFLLVGLAVGAYLGHRGGFVKKIFNVLALIGAIVIATRLTHPLGGFLVDTLMFSEPFGYILAFALVVIVIMSITILLYRRFGREGMSKSISQLAGIGLGLFEGAIVMSLVLLMLRVYDVPAQGTRESSLLYKPLVNFAPGTFDAMRPYLPWAGDFRDELSRIFEKYELFDQVPNGESNL